jgi:ureidoacrylate peracid hydrolase
MTDPGDRTATAYRARHTDAAFDPARTALLVIDPVNDFLSEGGAAWDLTQTTVEKHDVIGHIRQAIDSAHRRGIPVLFGPMAFTAEDYTDDQLQRRSGINRMMHERRMFLAGSWGADFHPDLHPGDHDIVLEPHKGIDVFETDLPEHLDRLGTTHLVIAGMTANLCCESTGRHAMERGFHVTYLHDAIGADNVAAYEAATHINYPLVANGIVDVDSFFDAIDNRDRQPHPGDTVLSSDRLDLGTITHVVAADQHHTSHLRVRKGRLLRRRFHVPTDVVTMVGSDTVMINLPKLVIDKMPWDDPPTHATRRAAAGPYEDDVEHLYTSTGPRTAGPWGA